MPDFLTGSDDPSLCGRDSSATAAAYHVVLGAKHLRTSSSSGAAIAMGCTRVTRTATSRVSPTRILQICQIIPPRAAPTTPSTLTQQRCPMTLSSPPTTNSYTFSAQPPTVIAPVPYLASQPHRAVHNVAPPLAHDTQPAATAHGLNKCYDKLTPLT